ncbi:MAG: VCBS repeat-containing protein, partial [Deltaproteobacteria bacterium]
QAPVEYATGVSPYRLTSSDFDGAGKQDLAVTNVGDNTVGVSMGLGTGAFQSQVSDATGGYPNDLTVGDFNGDGAQDVAVTNGGDNTSWAQVRAPSRHRSAFLQEIIQRASLLSTLMAMACMIWWYPIATTTPWGSR